MRLPWRFTHDYAAIPTTREYDFQRLSTRCYTTEALDLPGNLPRRWRRWLGVSALDLRYESSYLAAVRVWFLYSIVSCAALAPFPTTTRAANVVHNSHACQVFDGADQSKFTQSNAGIKRKTSTGGGVLSAVCPIYQEWPPGSPPYRIWADVRFLKPSTGTLTCYLRQFDASANMLSSVSVSKGSGITHGEINLSSLNVLFQTSHLSLHCQMPEGAQLLWYRHGVEWGVWF